MLICQYLNRIDRNNSQGLAEVVLLMSKGVLSCMLKSNKKVNRKSILLLICISRARMVFQIICCVIQIQKEKLLVMIVFILVLIRILKQEFSYQMTVQRLLNMRVTRKHFNYGKNQQKQMSIDGVNNFTHLKL